LVKPFTGLEPVVIGGCIKQLDGDTDEAGVTFIMNHGSGS